MRQPGASARAQASPQGPLAEDERTRRAQRLAIAFKNAGFDDDTRHEFIEYVTWGECQSGKDLTDDQAGWVFRYLRQLEEGQVELRYDEDGKLWLADPKTGVKR